MSYVLVNGESIDPTGLQGEGAVVQLKYFPTILCKLETGITEVQSLDDAVKLLTSDANTATETQETVEETVTEEKMEEEDAPLDMDALF